MSHQLAHRRGRSARLAAWFALTSLVACAGSKTPAESPPAQPAAAPTDAIAPGGHESAVRAVVDPEADVVAYLDGEGFRKSPLYRALENVLALVPGSLDKLSEIEADCGLHPVRSLKALAFSGSRAGEGIDARSITVAAELDVSPDAALDCVVRHIPEAQQEQLEGRRALKDPKDGWLVADGSLLIFGRREAVVAALARSGSTPAPLAASTYLHARVHAPNPLQVNPITVALSRTAKGARLEAIGQTASPEDAARAAQQLEAFREFGKQQVADRAAEGAAASSAASLLDAIALTTRGSAVSAALELPEREFELAITSMLSSIAVHGVRRYVANAKAAQARETVGAIAAALAAAAEKTQRFPASAPRVPAQVPAGTKVTPDATAWSHPSWKAIGFAPTEPQYYAYEFETAPDGKQATVRARGDIDGDGTPSTFELTLEIRPNGAIAFPKKLTETDPLE